MVVIFAVVVIPRDLARIVDGNSVIVHAKRVVDSSVDASAVKKSMTASICSVAPNDLAGVVDVVSKGLRYRGQRIVQDSVTAAAVKETVVHARKGARKVASLIRLHDLAAVVDALGNVPKTPNGSLRAVYEYV
jgi:hypothetical protein